MDEPQGLPDSIKGALAGRDPVTTIGVIRHLSLLRSSLIVGLALAGRYETEAEWQALLASAQFVDTIEELADIVRDMRHTLPELGDLADVQQIQQAVDQHYGRALDAVGILAEELRIPGEDLLTVLVNG